MTEAVAVDANAMVDTNIVIYAMRRARAADPDDLREMLASSSALIRQLSYIRVSAVTVVEVMRGLRPEERARKDVQSIFGRFQVEPVDSSAADLAVKLLEERNKGERVCPRCLCSDTEHACPKCHRTVSSQQKLNDAMIAATAETR